MLVLSRRLDESIVLPNCEVSITILRIAGSHVKLGISAPQQVKVHRQEVWERIQKETPLVPTAIPNRSLPIRPR